MIITFLLLLLGLALLLKGGDWLVDGASTLARKYRISELAIGLTIVAFGTSAPELVVNVLASVGGHADIAFGNVIGSNNFNLFLILVISGLIAPVVVSAGTVWKEIPMSLVAAVVLLLLANDQLYGQETMVLSRIDGIILLALFALFLFYISRNMRAETPKAGNEQTPPSSVKTVIFITAGLGGLIVGGRLVVDSAIEIARYFQWSEKIIGLTIVAAGTSLPELVTSLVAIKKKSNDIAVGNILGSNIFNIFLILGISSTIRPMPFSTVFNIDITILLAGTVFLFIAMFTGVRKKLDRWEAGLMVAFFVGYMVYLTMK
jgi:cation:H+ antiporter